MLPDRTTITTSHSATLSLHKSLPSNATDAHIIPNLNHSLLSIGQLCDAGCTAHFSSDEAIIEYNGEPILTGERSSTTNLWHITIPPAPIDTDKLQHNINFLEHNNNIIDNAALIHSAFRPNSTIAERIAYYHACCFSPVLSTWCKAIDAGHFSTWPDLTSAAVRQYPPQSIAMHKGHLDQSRKNQRSTSTNTTPTTELTITNNGLTDETSEPITTTDRTHFIFAACTPISGFIASDPTGRFILPSSTGNAYLLIVYDFDSNMIFAEPMKSRTATEHLNAFKRVHTILSARGLHPKLQRLDNEASTILKTFLTDNDIDFQLAPPQVHRRNHAERAIRVFKNHFIAGLCSTNPNFPLHLWDKLLPQALLTLNLLRSSHINPNLSAQALIYGNFDFNRTPIAPPGTQIVIHQKPSVRETWAPHGIDGWYLGPALEHYRCYRVWATETRAERITDTVAWLPTNVRMPTASSSEIIRAAANDIITAIHNPTSAATLPPLSDNELTALLQLAHIFNPDTTNPTETAPSSTIPPGFEPLTSPTPGEPRVPTTTTTPPPGVPTSPTPALPPTYNSSTGNSAQRRRRNRNKLKALITQTSSPPTSTSPTTTVIQTTPHPTSPTVPLAPPPHHHQHNTRYRSLSIAAHHLLSLTNNDHVALNHQHQTFHANAVIDAVTGATLEYRDLLKGPDTLHWLKGWCNEFRRLGPKGTQTIQAIAFTHIPKDRAIGNIRIVAALKPNKSEMHRVRFTVAHHHHDYNGPTSTPTVDITTVKCHINSTISTPGARYATIDISDFYLNTTMTRPEYMRISVKLIPTEIMEEYNLAQYVHNNYIYFQINKGLYGLVQAGKLAYDQLLQRLTAAAFYPAPHTTGLFLHRTRPISFTLCVDDFGIKYTRQEDLEFLTHTLQHDYKITIDLTGSKYLGLSLNWDYDHHTVDISMPGYIQAALTRFQHTTPKRPQHSPHSWIAPTYGAITQLAIASDTTPSLSSDDTNLLQQIIGTLLYYARAIDNTMLVAISTISSVQSQGTEATMQAAIQLLNYCATHPDAIIRYSASDMILHVHSDASYLSVHGARSRIGGYFFLSHTPPPSGYDATSTPAVFNGPIHVNSTIMTHVMSSAAEAELGALFYNAKDSEMLRTTLQSMGHPQPATPIQCDNACATGIVNNTVKQRRSRAMDMRFYWVRDRVQQGHFHIYWAPGSTNQADYFTKHHPTSHHRVERSRFLHAPPLTNAVIQGCVDLPAPATLPGTRSHMSHHTFSSESVPFPDPLDSPAFPDITSLAIPASPVSLPNRLTHNLL